MCADYQDVCRQLGEKDHLLTEQQRQSERDVEAARMEITRLLSTQDNERGQMQLDLVKARLVHFTQLCLPIYSADSRGLVVLCRAKVIKTLHQGPRLKAVLLGLQ